MATPIELEIRYLPKDTRERCEKALGIAKGERTHRVFVYGTLIAGEHNAHWASGARRVGARAVGRIFDTGYGFPAFRPEGEGTVKGEMLTVDDEGLKRMDVLEGYPRLYRREQITVATDRGGAAVAWVYIMNNLPKDVSVIESGDWVAYRKSKDRRQ